MTTIYINADLCSSKQIIIKWLPMLCNTCHLLVKICPISSFQKLFLSNSCNYTTERTIHVKVIYAYITTCLQIITITYFGIWFHDCPQILWVGHVTEARLYTKLTSNFTKVTIGSTIYIINRNQMISSFEGVYNSSCGAKTR